MFNVCELNNRNDGMTLAFPNGSKALFGTQGGGVRPEKYLSKTGAVSKECDVEAYLKCTLLDGAI